MVDRKKRYRLKLTAIIVVQAERSNTRYVFYTSNLSSSGALLRSSYEIQDCQVKLGDKLLMSIQLPAIDQASHEFLANGEVVRGDVDVGFGVRFDLGADQEAFLQSYISKFVGEFPETIE